jgi:hypothetical protein
MGCDELLEAAVAGKTNEVGDTKAFTKFIQVWTGKGCIPTEPKLLEPGGLLRVISLQTRRTH